MAKKVVVTKPISEIPICNPDDMKGQGVSYELQYTKEPKRGKHKSTDCPYCEGTGRIYIRREKWNREIFIAKICPLCKGNGKAITKKEFLIQDKLTGD